MTDQELVEFRDGELTQDEADRVRRTLAADPERRARLEAIRQADSALVAFDRLTAPSPDHVERGKATVRETLHDRTGARRRRRVLLVASALATAAAAAAAFWLVDLSPEIGVVCYKPFLAVQQQLREERLKPGSLIQAPSNSVSAHVDLPHVAKLVLAGNGILRIGDTASELELAGGLLEVNSTSGLRIAIARSPYTISVAPASSLKIHVDAHLVKISQVRGHSQVVGGTEEQVLEGRGELVLRLSPAGSTPDRE